MKQKFLILILFSATFLSSALIAVKAESTDTISQERYDRVCKWGILNPPECKKQIVKKNTVNTSKEVISTVQNTQKKKI